jgi:hypothetical protein
MVCNSEHEQQQQRQAQAPASSCARRRVSHAVGGAGAILVRVGLSMVQLGLEVRQELLVPAQPLRQMVSGHQVVRASRQGPRRHVAYRP